MTDISASSPGPSEHEGYILDAENAAEMARLMVQEHLLTKTMGGPLPEQSDLSHRYQILDIACGPGGWLLDLVKQYPHMHGIGIDMSNLMMDYATSLARSQGLSNVKFQVMDATQPLHFPDNTFDLINGRLLTGFLATHQWSALLQECARIMRPGGIIRITEAEWGFTNSMALDELFRLGAIGLNRGGHSFSPQGRNVGTSTVLRLLLHQAGFQNIQNRAHALDYSAGTEAHESNIQNLLVFHKLVQPFLVQMQIAKQEQLERLHEQMAEEFQKEDFCGIDYFLTVWGQKS